MNDIAQKLDRLSRLYEQKQKYSSEKQEIINGLITPEIKAKIDEVEAEFKQQEEIIIKSIDSLESEIKADTAKFGSTVRSSGFMAVWSKGRITWDTKGLTSFAGSHPEVLEYKREGNPIVSVRRLLPD
jgi:hypothetical protein